MECAVLAGGGSIRELFQEGQYRQLVGQIEDTLTQTPSQPLHTTLLLQNNLLVCKLMLASSLCGQAAVVAEFETVLLTCSSVAAGEELLYTELVALYNYLYTSLLCGRPQPQPTSPLTAHTAGTATSTNQDNLYHTVNRTLFIVYKQLAVDGLDVQGLASMSPRDCCLTLIHRCLSRLLYTLTGDVRVSVVLCWCVSLLAILEMGRQQQHNPGSPASHDVGRGSPANHDVGRGSPASHDVGRSSPASHDVGPGSPASHDVGRCLDMLHRLLASQHKHTSTQHTQGWDGLMVSVQADHHDVATSAGTVADVVHYLQAVQLYHGGCWADCHTALQKIQTDELKVLAGFLSGWCLYHDGQLMEAVAVLMETLRSQRPISQRLKARTYTCIATCFTNMGKFQLAIHMYREALSADFGYLLPLYRVSQLYRQQSTSESPDMELECLNLLVTALEMGREGLRCETSGVELLQLVEVEDQDITYPHALYMMASRALAHHKYEAASEKFTQLISYLKSWQADAQALKAVPSLEEIYQEAAGAVLACGRFVECVSLCDTVLAANTGHSHHHSTTLGHTRAHSSSFTGTMFSNSYHDDSFSQLLCEEEPAVLCRGKKRKCVDVEGEAGSQAHGAHGAQASTLKLKAEALLKLGDKTAALTCLARAADSISGKRRAVLQKHMKTEERPSCKRRKLDAGSSVEEVGRAAGTAAGTLQLERDIYTSTMDILTSQNQHKQAEHYRRLASQLAASTCQHWESPSQHGANTSQHGSSSSQHGANTSQHGSSSSQHGANTSQHGSSSSQHGANTSQHGSNSSQFGANLSQVKVEKYEIIS